MTRGGRPGEDGSALVELVWLGLLVMVPLVYLIATIFSVQQSAYGVTEAARAAGRAYTLSPDVATAERRAYDAARVAMADQGVTLRPDGLHVRCAPAPADCLTPGSTVTITVSVQVPLPMAPSLFGQPAASIAVDASHAEPYGTFREAAR
jgi:hypothetical protein